MASTVDTPPEFLFIDGDPTTNVIRTFLQELEAVRVTTRTGSLFAGLATLPPAMRLSLNLSTLSGIMSNVHVSNVLEDGLLLDERNALIELDVQGFSLEARTTARALLNVKERWIMAKTLSGLFRSCRDTEGGYIRLDT